MSVIISHAWRFIFLKTNKTGGTSIEIALSRFCGERDVITPITPEDEEIRRALGYRGPQNCHVPLRRYPLDGLLGLARTGKRLRFYNHMTAREVRRIVPRDVWNNYYKFCFERNPWARVVSRYYHWCHTRRTEPQSVSEFLARGGATPLKSRGFDLYTIDGRIAVDKVCFYENLEEEMRGVLERVGIQATLTLPRAKAGFRPEGIGYTDVLSAHDRDKIAEIFAAEIALFGYQY